MKQNIVDALKKNFLFQITYFVPYVPAMKLLKKNNTVLCTDI